MSNAEEVTHEEFRKVLDAVLSSMSKFGVAADFSPPANGAGDYYAVSDWYGAREQYLLILSDKLPLHQIIQELQEDALAKFPQWSIFVDFDEEVQHASLCITRTEVFAKEGDHWPGRMAEHMKNMGSSSD